MVNLSCQETGMELGCVGPYENIQSYLQTKEEALEILVEEMGGSNYFRDSEIMLEILTHVHALAEEGSLHCPCGEDRVELEIFPDRVELHCRHCSRMAILQSETEEDLSRLKSIAQVELTQQPFREKRKPRRHKRDNHQQ